MERDGLIELTADIVAAYVSNNSIASGDLSRLIGEVHGALRRSADGAGRPAARPEQPKPAITAKRSITPDYLICLEDGKRFKSLKRHLRTHYDLTPAEYRTKWGLPSDYPMVAPNYAKTRSQLALQMGLGQNRARA
jgi:predicted transcriptional regulator